MNWQIWFNFRQTVKTGTLRLTGGKKEERNRDRGGDGKGKRINGDSIESILSI